MVAKQKRYTAICGRCYSCHIGHANSKKEANRLAVSHMNTYKHETWITDNEKQVAL